MWWPGADPEHFTRSASTNPECTATPALHVTHIQSHDRTFAIKLIACLRMRPHAAQAGIDKLNNLRVLFMSNNKIAAWSDIDRLAPLDKLEDLLLVGNPLYNEYKDNNALADYRVEVCAVGVCHHTQHPHAVKTMGGMRGRCRGVECVAWARQGVAQGTKMRGEGHEGCAHACHQGIQGGWCVKHTLQRC